MLSIWGHSFRAEGRTVSPAFATSVQLHSRVKADYVMKVLRESGRNSVYWIPKDEDSSKPDAAY